MRRTRQLKAQIKKKLWKRVSVFSLGLAVLVLIDEWIKEGYVFNPKDLLCVGSHEFLFLVFSVIAVVSMYISEEGECKDAEEQVEN